MDNLKSLTKSQGKDLISIIKNKFLNIFKVLRNFDLDEANNFLKKNAHFYTEYLKKNPHQHSKSCGKDHHDHSSCDHGPTGIIFVPKDKRSPKEQIVFELTENWKIETELPKLLEFLSKRFFNIKRRGIKDWNSQAESFVLQEVMKEGVNQYYHKRVLQELKQKTKGHSTDHMLIANPSQYGKFFEDLGMNIIDDQNMKILNSQGNENNWCVVENFIDQIDLREKAKQEILYLERDGRFEKRVHKMEEINEKFLWVNFSDINKEHFPA